MEPGEGLHAEVVPTAGHRQVRGEGEGAGLHHLQLEVEAKRCSKGVKPRPEVG
jgi:hypothetical protein